MDEDPKQDETLEYDPVMRLYELIHVAVKQLVNESGDITTTDIMAALGIVIGEVAEMHIEGDDGADEEGGFSED